MSEPGGESTPSTGGSSTCSCAPGQLPLAADQRDLAGHDRERAALRPGAAADQHAELVSVYEGAGVRCHYLEPDPHLLPGLRPRLERDDPGGAVVTQLNQWWRRGEYAPVIRFYEAAGIPVFGMVTAAALEGGDVMIVEPGRVVIGTGESRTQERRRPPARWLVRGERLGGPGRADPRASSSTSTC